MNISSLLVKPAGPDCNLACGYCFYASKEALFDQGAHRMDLALLETAVREYLAQAGASASIGFQGGEPTLCGLEFFQKAFALIQRAKRPGQRVSIALQTNGMLIDASWARLLAQHGVLVGLSLDGPGDAHDGYRVDFGGHPTQARVSQVLTILRDAGVEVNTLTVLHAGNVGMGGDLVRWLLDQGSDYLQFIPCVERDASGIAPFSVTPEQFGDFLIKAFELWLSGGLPKFYVRMFDELLIAFIEYQDPSCQRSCECRANLVVEHNGEIYPCDFFVSPEERLGRVGETSLLELAASQRLHEFVQKKRMLPEACAACRWRPLCNGDCPKYRLDGDPYLCAGYRRFYEHAVPRLRALKQRLYDGDPRAAGWKRREASIQRNGPCPCGSGTKAKACCLPIKS